MNIEILRVCCLVVAILGLVIATLNAWAVK